MIFDSPCEGTLEAQMRVSSIGSQMRSATSLLRVRVLSALEKERAKKNKNKNKGRERSIPKKEERIDPDFPKTGDEWKKVFSVQVHLKFHIICAVDEQVFRFLGIPKGKLYLF